MARVYRRLLAVLDGMGVLFAITDDVKISTTPEVIGEMVEVFADIAWHEAGLTIQTVKSKIYVQPSAREGWVQFLDVTPRNPEAPLPIHDIPDGSYLENAMDPGSIRIWPTINGINVLGTPLGSPEFIESYLFGKGIMQRQILFFIQDVAAAGFPREEVAMLTGAAGHRLTHLLKSIHKNPQTMQRIREMDAAHVSTWLYCLTASTDLEYALGPPALDQLSDLLDLPPAYGGNRTPVPQKRGGLGTIRLLRWHLGIPNFLLPKDQTPGLHRDCGGLGINGGCGRHVERRGLRLSRGTYRIGCHHTGHPYGSG